MRPAILSLFVVFVPACASVDGGTGFPRTAGAAWLEPASSSAPQPAAVVRARAADVGSANELRIDDSGWREAPASFAEVAPATVAPVPAVFGKNGYTRLSAGLFSPMGDIDSLDDGINAQLAFGRGILPFLSLEAAVGYINAEGSSNQELQAVPLLIKGRVDLPILIFGIYGGLGIGGMYAEYEAGPFDDSDFVLAGTAFLGVEVGLGDLALGLEYEYLTSEETDNNFTIEGQSVLLTLRLPF